MGNTEIIANLGIDQYKKRLEDCFRGITKKIEDKIADALAVTEDINNLVDLPEQTRNQLKSILFIELVALYEKEKSYDSTYEIMGITKEQGSDALMDVLSGNYD
ncbi:MAG: hypothetical protein KAI57_00295 [Candidatus Pacebacteria bacterium]|nr:hypothetical protein [Candidatus Paceibacterota bacterium]